MFLEAKSLCKSYPNGGVDTQVLDKMSFSSEQGEVVVVVGPSGSGKSTLLNVIGGLETASAGKVIVDKTDLSELNGKKLSEYRRNYVGFVFQFYNLIPNLTVKENIQVCEELGSHPLDIDELINSVGLKGEENKFPNQLSGGQQQRVAIARALIKNPRLLLCDEPTGALDTKTSQEVLTLFEDLNQKYGTTILMITHNELIGQMAHRVITIKDGKIIKNELNKNAKKVKEIEW